MPNQEYIEDEIDLRDYINVILKRKKLILTVFFVAVITTAIASFRMPKVYEVTSIIQVGRIDELLINREEAKEIFLSQNLLRSIIKELNLGIEVNELKENTELEDVKGTNLLKIKVQYPDPGVVVKINKVIVNSFISQGQAIYQERILLIYERLNELDTEIKNTEEDIRRTQNLINELSSSTVISQQETSIRIILLQNTLPNYENHLYILKNRRNELKVLLFKAKDFKIIELPIEPKCSIKPKKRQNIAIAGLVSLMFGTFLAFFAEYWQSSKVTEKR